ncbi:uncharacterized protein LOC130760120 isoform X2 [Actinidia eriantha]|uniref:uncharacterized protein LOC130760120 isoform X2 n=1 Tax=Actinidia eriantha TaxID=165200 RepID=UPI0025888421|nr:uncharacterized protein LOC130760120 isoform X2 [Actinidia eriantha]
MLLIPIALFLRTYLFWRKNVQRERAILTEVNVCKKNVQGKRAMLVELRKKNVQGKRAMLVELGKKNVQEPQSLTLKEFLDSFDRIEKNHVESLSQYYDVIKHYCRSGFSRLDKIIELTIRNYESANQIEVPWQDWDESTLKVVPVGEYMIPDHWAPILRALIAKYGDIGCNSRWTSKMKMLCMMVVCIAIEDMCCTKVEDVTADLLLRWFCSLRIGLEAKFEINFAFERLTRVACAHLGFEVNLPKAYEIRELEMKLETKRELLSLGQDCCLDAVKLKGQTAGMGLL